MEMFERCKGLQADPISKGRKGGLPVCSSKFEFIEMWVLHPKGILSYRPNRGPDNPICATKILCKAANDMLLCLTSFLLVI